MGNQAVAFTHVDKNHVKKSTFDLSHFHLTTQKHGELLPVFCEEVLPGDNFKLKTNVLARYMPLVNPPMSPLKLQVHYFYVRNTHIMKNWENFMLQRKENGVDVDLPRIPYSMLKNNDSSDTDFMRILDRLGFPTKSYDPIEGITSIDDYPDGVFSALPLLAYYKVWVDYFVDQNLDPAFELYMEKNYDDGITSSQLADYIATLTDGSTKALKYRAWESDYFTSILPWPQRGNAVLLPLEIGGESLLLTTGNIITDLDGDTPPNGALKTINSVLSDNADNPVKLTAGGTIDWSDATIEQHATINDLRYNIRLQKFLENNARVGMRYAQRMAYEFDVNEKYLDDHRSVYLGDFTQRVQISEVPQTSSTVSDGADASPQGNLAANASIYGSEDNFNFTAHDHGFIIGIASIITEPMYSQGIRKKFIRQTAMDYYRPEFEGIGEQPVLNMELMYQPTTDIVNSNNIDTLGYLPYGSDLRTIYSYFTGEMRTTFLDWHLGRLFSTGAAPQLNTDLVYTENEDFQRIFAVQDDSDNVLLHFHFDLKATRPISVFGTPASL